jgi:NAD(P)H-hydrate epimerase
MVKPFAETPERALDLDAQSELLSFAKKCSVFAVGPGLSQDKATAQLVRRIAPRLKGPIVLDADGISAFCGYTDALKKATGSGASIVLTPHPGELAKLTGRSVEDIQKSRKDIALKVACEYNIVLVLKGHGTVVADPSGKLYINDTGNPGMASGGVGDVLTGVIAAFLAQGANTFDAAVLGVYFHGLAGDIAAKEKGILSLIATDILDKLPEALRQLG